MAINLVSGLLPENNTSVQWDINWDGRSSTCTITGIKYANGAIYNNQTTGWTIRIGVVGGGANYGETYFYSKNIAGAANVQTSYTITGTLPPNIPESGGLYFYTVGNGFSVSGVLDPDDAVSAVYYKITAEDISVTSGKSLGSDWTRGQQGRNISARDIIPSSSHTGYTYDSSTSIAPWGDSTVYNYFTPNSYSINYHKNDSNGTITNFPSNGSIYYDSKISSATPSNTYRVTFNGNGGTPTSSYVDSTRSFTKWNTAANGTGIDWSPGDVFNQTSTLNLYAQWAAATSVPLTSASRTGYSFQGWYTEASGGTQVVSPYTPPGNKTLYAHWSINSYTLTVNPNGGTWNGSSSSQTFTQDYGTTKPIPNPTRTGYTFTGWAHTGGGSLSGTTYTFGASDGALTAQWSIDSHTLTVNPNGGTWEGKTSSQSFTQNYNTQKSISNPTWTGHIFTRWTLSGGGSFSSGVYTLGTSDGTLTAGWNLESYTVWYKKGSNGTGTDTSDTKTYGVDLTLKGAIFTRVGYTQTGWSTSDGGSKAFNLNASYTSNSSITLYPYWTIDTWIVSYDANGGSSIPPDQIKTYNVALTLADSISRASQVLDTYTVTYNYNGGSGTPASATATSTKYFNFDSWNTKQDGSGTRYIAKASYTANAAATMHAQWSETISVSSVTLPSPTRSGYTCTGWWTLSSGGTKVGDPGGSYQPPSSVPIYAQWLPDGIIRLYNSSNSFHLYAIWVYTGDNGGPNSNGWHRGVPMLYCTANGSTKFHIGG